MARELVPDELWKRIEPLLPAHPPRPKGGRRRLADRQVLTGIVFVLKTGIPWEDLPGVYARGDSGIHQRAPSHSHGTARSPQARANAPHFAPSQRSRIGNFTDLRHAPFEREWHKRCSP